MKIFLIAALVLGLAVALVWRVARGVEEAPRAVKAESPGVLRVCADPNNLPFSNEAREGFENRIAELIARDLNRTVQYTWWAQRRGHIRNTLNAGTCDVIAGIPTALDMVLVTEPYYRSTYVFVYRKDRGWRVQSLDDPRLRRLRVGVQLIGDDYENTPPAHALSRRGIIRNVRGYAVAGDYSRANPPARIIEAVAGGEVDIAIAWGPMAGYFARRSAEPLVVEPVSPQIDLPFLPFVFDVSMGVRRGDEALRLELDRALQSRRGEIAAILREFGVPDASDDATSAGFPRAEEVRPPG
jgi:mxaJ protein